VFGCYSGSLLLDLLLHTKFVLMDQEIPNQLHLIHYYMTARKHCKWDISDQIFLNHYRSCWYSVRNSTVSQAIIILIEFWQFRVGVALCKLHKVTYLVMTYIVKQFSKRTKSNWVTYKTIFFKSRFCLFLKIMILRLDPL